MELIILGLFGLSTVVGFFNVALGAVLVGTLALLVVTGSWIYVLAGLVIYLLIRA